MAQLVSNLTQLIRSMQPVLNEGIYCFATLSDGQYLPFEQTVATIREAEGLSVIVTEQTAGQYGLNIAIRCAWLTLNVYSDLAAVGLTAAFARALGEAGISCNVVAGTRHDHIFVPYEHGQKALAVLQRLQQQAV
ncbi:ACT domain-containing protein [Neisseria iguanae]|uniref:Acetyltransferase n=1 Tax=Neisseria iguanae TaxID=90242 RepID=A0A2P7TY38_9NEIS|nr:ACT domain-containing protein [Neisseria iguanae]PSJ79642.1 acetyltransferase [Neisseria iguanae]